MKIKRILAKRICLIAGTVLSVVIGGQLSAQTMIAKKAKVYAVADAHLDTQWNWDIQTTIKEYIWNTLNQNLFLLNRYPNYIFNFEGGVKYAWMKEYYPREYELMKAFVKAGRWHVSGASWDATDTLVPSTESFIRNIMLGQEFYRKELFKRNFRYLFARLFWFWLDTSYCSFSLWVDRFLFTETRLAYESFLW